MKTSHRTITVTLIALAAASLFAISTAAAQDPVPGLLISAGDLVFLEGANVGIRTPVAESAPVGLFSAREAQSLAAPYAPAPTPAVAIAVNPVPGLMISGIDLQFIMGTGTAADDVSDTWADGGERFTIGR
jgi:hypothetical protein